MIEFDKDGYTYSFSYMLHSEIMKQICDLRNINELDERSYAELFQQCRGKESAFETGIRDKFDFKSFPEFMLDFLSIVRPVDPVGRFMEVFGRAMGRGYKYDGANEALLTYHTLRFIKHGKSVYKITPHKADFLNQLKLDITGSMLFAPHPEFMISLPKGAVTTDLGHLMNIYVSEDEFNAETYKNSRYVTDAGVAYALGQPNVKKIFRAMGVFYNDNGSSQTSYFQLPISDDKSVSEIFNTMMEMMPSNLKESVEAVFRIVLNTCAYLGVRDADVQKVLGIKYTASSNPKKLRISERNNRLYGYNYNVVGKIYDERCRSQGGGGCGSAILKRFKVRAHIRAQWYGPRESDRPGTEQRLILIEEHEKGTDLNVALSEKVCESEVCGLINQ